MALIQMLSLPFRVVGSVAGSVIILFIAEPILWIMGRGGRP